MFYHKVMNEICDNLKNLNFKQTNEKICQNNIDGLTTTFEELSIENKIHTKNNKRNFSMTTFTNYDFGDIDGYFSDVSNMNSSISQPSDYEENYSQCESFSDFESDENKFNFEYNYSNSFDKTKELVCEHIKKKKR